MNGLGREQPTVPRAESRPAATGTYEPAITGLGRRELLAAGFVLAAVSISAPTDAGGTEPPLDWGQPFDDGTWFDDGTGWVD